MQPYTLFYIYSFVAQQLRDVRLAPTPALLGAPRQGAAAQQVPAGTLRGSV